MFRGWRPPLWYVQRDISILIRSFPSGRVVITRPRQVTQSDFGEPAEEYDPVFTGEALFVPAGGTVARYGLGQVEEDKPRMLIAGWHDVQQGDMLTVSQLLPGGRGWTPPRRYQVLYAPVFWHGFIDLTLENYEQGVTR